MINNKMLVIVAATLLNAGMLTAQPNIREPIGTPTLITGPAPVGFRVAESTPASVTFAWGASSGAASYQLMRTSTGGASWTYLAPNPIPASTLTYNDQSGIDYRSSYTYRLQVNYTSGPSGFIDLPVTLPKPANPVNVTAKQTNGGAVTISWTGAGNPVTIFGPGIPQTGVVATGYSYTVTGLANGQYTWTLGTFYQPGNISTPATEFPSVSAAVTPFSGTYRITLLGFVVNNPTADDILDSDGKGDEIIPMAFVQQFDQASGNRYGAGTLVKGYIHGQNQGGKFSSRIMAGTASNKGGLQKGDVFPSGLMQGATGSLSTTTFPLKVFETFMTRDKEVLVIYPSLWESDDSTQRWLDYYKSNLDSRTMNALNPATTVGAKLRQALDAPGISEIRGEDWFKMDSWGPNAKGDRPIGIQQSSGPTDAGGFYDRIIVLNQRKIEEALAAPAKYPGMPTGTIGLSFTEGGVLHVTGLPDPMSWNFPASYVLYLRVEAVR